jgi:hypothetical protein
VSSWYACCCCVWLQPTSSALGGTQCIRNHGTELARSFARGTLWLWTLRCCSDTCVSLRACGVMQVIGAQLSELECGVTTVDFVGQLRATDEVAPKPRAAAARRLVLRLSRCSVAPCLAALRVVHARSLVLRCLGLSIRPAIRRSIPCCPYSYAVATQLSPSPLLASSPPAAASSFFLDTPLRLWF